MHGVEKDCKTLIRQIYKKCFLCRDSANYDTAEDLHKHEETEEHKKEKYYCRMNDDGNAEALIVSTHLKGDEYKQQLND